MPLVRWPGGKTTINQTEHPLVCLAEVRKALFALVGSVPALKMLLARLRRMTDRNHRHDYDIGDYWNAIDESVEVLEMIETKLGTFKVVCEGCNTQEYSPFLPNRDKEVCDVCGDIRGRITYEQVSSR